MENNNRAARPGFRIILLLALAAAGLHSCTVSEKNFSDGMVLHNSFYHNALLGSDCADCVLPDSMASVFYLGFHQQYAVNNSLTELSNTPGLKHQTAVHEVTSEIEKANEVYHGRFIPPRDSDEVLLIEIEKKSTHSASRKSSPFKTSKGMIDTGVYYLMISLKYSQFAQHRGSPGTYGVSGFGHAYLGKKTGENNILFFAEPKIVGKKDYDDFWMRIFGRVNRYFLKAKKRDKTVFLLEEYLPSDSAFFEHYYGDTSDLKRSGALDTAGDYRARLSATRFSETNVRRERRVDSASARVHKSLLSNSISFNYLLIGNDNQISGNKYLDINSDAVFQLKNAITFTPYPSRNLMMNDSLRRKR